MEINIYIDSFLNWNLQSWYNFNLHLIGESRKDLSVESHFKQILISTRKIPDRLVKQKKTLFAIIAAFLSDDQIQHYGLPNPYNL